MVRLSQCEEVVLALGAGQGVVCPGWYCAGSSGQAGHSLRGARMSSSSADGAWAPCRPEAVLGAGAAGAGQAGSASGAGQSVRSRQEPSRGLCGSSQSPSLLSQPWRKLDLTRPRRVAEAAIPRCPGPWSSEGTADFLRGREFKCPGPAPELCGQRTDPSGPQRAASGSSR